MEDGDTKSNVFHLLRLLGEVVLVLRSRLSSSYKVWTTVVCWVLFVLNIYNPYSPDGP